MAFLLILMQKDLSVTPHCLLADLGFTAIRMVTDNKFTPPLPPPHQTLPRPLQLPLGTVGIQKPGHSYLIRPVNYEIMSYMHRSFSH